MFCEMELAAAQSRGTLARGPRSAGAASIQRTIASVRTRRSSRICLSSFCRLRRRTASVRLVFTRAPAARDDAVDDSLYNITVGAYRLVHDPKLYGPIWQRSQRSLKRALLLAVPYALVAFPLTRLWVTFILARSPLSPKDIHNAAYLGISPVTYTTWTLTLGQLSMLVEWMLARELKKSCSEVYERTVESRGKRALARLSSCSYEPRLTSAPLPGLDSRRLVAALYGGVGRTAARTSEPLRREAIVLRTPREPARAHDIAQRCAAPGWARRGRDDPDWTFSPQCCSRRSALCPA